MTSPARVIVVTPDELAQLVRDAVRAELAGRSTSDDWITSDDVARMLDVERSTIPALVRREGLPCYRPGRGYTFKRSEVVAWLEARADRPGSHGKRHGGTLRALRGGKR